MNGLCQHPASESFDIQIFDRNQPEPIYNFARFLVLKIRTLIAHANVCSLKKMYRLAATIAAFITPCYLALAAT